MKKALLALADGTVLEGRALGYEGEAIVNGETVQVNDERQRVDPG